MSNCLVPFRRSAFGLSSFTARATNQWNALPEDIKGCKVHGLFKLRLKSYIIYITIEIVVVKLIG